MRYRWPAPNQNSQNTECALPLMEGARFLGADVTHMHEASRSPFWASRCCLIRASRSGCEHDIRLRIQPFPFVSPVRPPIASFLRRAVNFEYHGDSCNPKRSIRGLARGICPSSKFQSSVAPCRTPLSHQKPPQQVRHRLFRLPGSSPRRAICRSSAMTQIKAGEGDKRMEACDCRRRERNTNLWTTSTMGYRSRRR